MTHLAKEFAISDVALHKICRKHGIPNPPLGWWAKKAAGKKVKRIPLPEAKAGTADRITIANADLSRESSALANVREQARIRASEDGWRSPVSSTIISSREFNQDIRGARKAADKGPIIITDRRRPAHVLLRFEDYQKLLVAGPSLLEVLAQKELGDFAFDPPRMATDISRPAALD
jgi:hypothetical protein